MLETTGLRVITAIVLIQGHGAGLHRVRLLVELYVAIEKEDNLASKGFEH